MDSCTVGLFTGNPMLMTALADGLKSYPQYRIISVLYDVPAASPDVDFLIVDLSDDFSRAVRLLELESSEDFGSPAPRVLCIADEMEYRRFSPGRPPDIHLYGFIAPFDVEQRIGPALSAVDSGLSVYPAGFTISEDGTEERLSSGTDSDSSLLTPRELDVLLAVASGLPSKAIAADLGISERTVKFHLNALFEKLGVQSRTEAAMEGARRGLIPL